MVVVFALLLVVVELAMAAVVSVCLVDLSVLLVTAGLSSDLGLIRYDSYPIKEPISENGERLIKKIYWFRI